MEDTHAGPHMHGHTCMASWPHMHGHMATHAWLHMQGRCHTRMRAAAARGAGAEASSRCHRSSPTRSDGRLGLPATTKCSTTHKYTFQPCTI